MQYHIHASAILYILHYNDLPGIYGVADPFPGKAPAEIEAEFPRLEEEMCISGLGSMDFDGVFTPDTPLLQAITDCARCSQVLSVPMRRDRIVRELTLFFCPGNTLALEQVAEQSYILHTAFDPVDLVLQFLKLPESTCFPHTVLVDSVLIQQKNVLEMVCGGGDPDMVQLAVDAAGGIAGYAQLLLVQDLTIADMRTLLYNGKGILLVDVVYTPEEEQIQLQPLDRARVAEYIQDLADRMGG